MRLQNKTIKSKSLRTFCILLTALLILSISTGCTSKKEDGRPIVYASFYPIYDLTKTIGTDHIDLRSFMPTSATTHNWEPSPKRMKDLEEADMLIVNGANMEKWLPSVRENLPDLKIVVLSEKADLISYTGAAAIGDFQIMGRAHMEKGRYPLIFGHTHEDYMRIALLKDDKTMTEDQLIAKGREMMEDIGTVVPQKSVIDVESEQVYRLEMGHNSGEIFLDIPEDGDWIIYSDRLSEDILSYVFMEDEDTPLDMEILLEGSSQGVDQITYDPHSWLSIDNAKVYINTITEELTELLPKYQREFGKNRFAAIDELTLLEQEYKNKFKELGDDDKHFIVIHYAYEYLAREFDLIQYPLQGLTSMDDPSIRSIVKAIGYAEELGIDTIFYEYGSPTAIAESISEELEDGRIAPLVSMEYAIPGMSIDDMSYIDFLEMNLKNLYETLDRS